MIGAIRRRYVFAGAALNDDDGAVPTADEDTWIERLRGADTPTPIAAHWMEWLHEIYTTRGPLAPAIVEDLACEEVLRRAQAAAALVAEDVRATLASPTDITVTIEDERMRVVVNAEIASGARLMLGRSGLGSKFDPELSWRCSFYERTCS
jgi:hypothetical protein